MFFAVVALGMASGCHVRPPRFVVAYPASLAARNDDSWMIQQADCARPDPAPDAGAAPGPR
jgi:hypothetical protein